MLKQQVTLQNYKRKRLNSKKKTLEVITNQIYFVSCATYINATRLICYIVKNYLEAMNWAVIYQITMKYTMTMIPKNSSLSRKLSSTI